MRILGIDPGLRITGYGCVSVNRSGELAVIEAGVIRIPTTGNLGQRLHYLHQELESALEELKPDLMSVESLFSHPERAATGIRMGHARGVILLAAAARSIELVEHPPAEVKKALTGNGRADKRQMQLAITQQCNLAEVPEPPDVADALAVAMCAARRLEGHILTQLT